MKSRDRSDFLGVKKKPKPRDAALCGVAIVVREV